jgi:hypothetical protein
MTSYATMPAIPIGKLGIVDISSSTLSPLLFLCFPFFFPKLVLLDGKVVLFRHLLYLLC